MLFFKEDLDINKFEFEAMSEMSQSALGYNKLLAYTEG